MGAAGGCILGCGGRVQRSLPPRLLEEVLDRMEKLEHPLWIVDLFNAILGPPVRAIGEALGYHFTGHHVIPNYVVMVLLIVTGLTVLSLVVRSRLSVEN